MSRLDITANIMVKNEEAKIVRCIESIIAFVDEIVVVDTGSTDNTIFLIKELVKKHGSEKIVLLFHDWENDFSLIRNFMIENSKGRYIFQIDADEFLDNSQQLEVQKDDIINSLERELPIILSPIIRNTNGSTCKTIPRLFKNNKDYFYVGNVHEELRYKGNKCLNNIAIDLLIHHDGYEIDAIVAKDKMVRNINLLELILKKEPNNPRWNYFWIRENYYAGIDRKQIIKCAEKFIMNAENKNEYMLVYIILALCYIEIDRYEAARNIISFLKESGYKMDACFVELTLSLATIRQHSLEVDKIISEVCSIENFNSQLNGRGDHVKIQMFKLLFSLARYMEAFCILDEIDCNIKKEAIIPELKEIKKEIDKALG